METYLANWTGFTTSLTSSPPPNISTSLSAILESPSPRLRKYFLSAKAAQGILRRASKRGRVLPAQLQQALESLATQGNPTADTSPVSERCKLKGATVGGGSESLIVTEHTHTHTPISTLQGGGKRGYRIDAESAAGGHLIITNGSSSLDQ